MAKQRRSLGGKVVAITGGARGIGKATATALVRKGCRVAIGDLDLELAEKTAAELGGGPARYLATPDGRSSIGFITPLSQHFCATCNRVRLSVDGTLYLCLGQEEKFEFRPLLRGGASDAELEAAIREAIELKPHKHEFNAAPQKIIRFMAQTGG